MASICTDEGIVASICTGKGIVTGQVTKLCVAFLLCNFVVV